MRATSQVPRGVGLAWLLLTTVPLAGAAQWVEPPGEGWAQLAVFHHDTRDRFDFAGDQKRFFADGHAVATSLYVTAALGLARGLDTWVQVPFHRLDFTDAAGDRDRTGFGDPRLFLRVAPLGFVGWSFPLAIRAGVKLPGGDFPVDAEIIPLGEGQRDWELMVELGRSFHPRPAYVMGWLGYRWREANVERSRDFGDELFFFAALGGNFGRLGYKLAGEGWRGRTPVLEGLSVPNARREMLQLLPSLFWPAGPGAFELGARLPLAGKNLPAGAALVVGYFVEWSIPGWAR